MKMMLTAIALLLPLTCIPGTTSSFHIPPSSHSIRSPFTLDATTTVTATSPLTSHEETSPSPAQSPRLLLEYVDQIITTSSDPLSINEAQSPSLDPSHILGKIDEDHERDVRWAQASTLPFESEIDAETYNSIEYESIHATKDEDIAIRTKLSTPLLTLDEINLLQRACESYWNRPIDGEDGALKKSRFSYQRKGNSEAHLSDVVKYTQQSNSNEDENASTSTLVKDLLLNRIYPWIRDAYLSREEDGSELELYIYDSLFIRYNATEANANANIIDPLGNKDGERVVGAGQPLHRDLGYVSVNIMLNPREEFEGGGTFFENQLLPTIMLSENKADGVKNEVHTTHPLKPLGPGGALAHFSSSRHAGAATYTGVRDILVMFLATTEKKKSTTSTISAEDNKNSCPRRRQTNRWEYNARLKSAARPFCSECCSNNVHDELVCRMRHHRLAIDQVYNDGEAWHYLGMALLDYHDYRIANNAVTESSSSGDDSGLSHQGGQAIIELAVSCLEEASKYTPCDARLYNNIGIALERLLQWHTDNSMQSKATDLDGKIKSAYQTSVMIHSTCEQVGCDVGADYESACLNYGLYLSKLDEFDGAIDILSRIASRPDGASDEGKEIDAAMWARQRVIGDAAKLLSFCMRQSDKSR